MRRRVLRDDKINGVFARVVDGMLLTRPPASRQGPNLCYRVCLSAPALDGRSRHPEPLPFAPGALQSGHAGTLAASFYRGACE